MVERPIKKSERQSQANTDKSSENLDSVSPNESNSYRSKSRGNRSSGKGKKGAFAEESKPPVNPALARGPKPAKPQPKVEIEPESEPVSEETQD
jgi:hypothetical protein